MKRSSLVSTLAAVFILFGDFHVSAEPLAWPREVKGSNEARIVLYQPQVDSWEGFETLTFRLAAELYLRDEDRPIPAALEVQASTTTDLAARTVTAYELSIIDVRISGAHKELAPRIREIMTSYLSGMSQDLSLDTVLAHFEDGRARLETNAVPVSDLKRPAALVGETPDILVSFEPAVLVLFDGEPVFAEIEKTRLEFAVNTNWDMFHYTKKSIYYLLYEDAWLEASAATGPWRPADKLPKTFKRIPKTENFEAVREHVPGEKIPEDEAPRVYVSDKPAELIVIDGAPVEEEIVGTELAWIINTENNLFRSKTSGDYYYLVSGRWFRAPSLKGPWSPVAGDLPDSFASIPADHPAAAVRVSVPGTPEAEEAVLLANIPQKAQVRRKDATLTVSYYGEPQFRRIAGADIFYAVNTPFDVFQIGSRYYVCHNGVWFEATEAEGPWVVAEAVPDPVYTIPPTSAKYHVTHVYIYDSTPDTVIVGYTPGYTGVYVSNGVVVYGTGYYYSPYIYYSGYGYPIYWGYPYSYGVAAYYNPYTASYGRGSAVYGPYGGAGWGAAYNPATGTYARGASASGPYQAGSAAQAYNPRTDTYGATYQRSNAYASWGESVISRGDEWVRTANYSDSRGSVAGLETSQGAKAGALQTDQGTAYAGKDADNNVYAGKDGNVYRRSEDGWSSYNDGDWQTVEKPETASTQFQERTTQFQQQEWSEKTFEHLERDWQARDSASRRSQDFKSWRSNRSGPSKGGSRSRGGRGRRN
ncbi:MAG: hypothetical protein AAFY84_11470 [Pseudomonadota bacterium]